MWAFYHASPSRNRESILSHGLIGHRGPHLWGNRNYGQPHGNYVLEGIHDALRYATNYKARTISKTDQWDIWQVDMSGLDMRWDNERALLHGELPLAEALSGPLEWPPRWYTPEWVSPARLTHIQSADKDTPLPVGFDPETALPESMQRAVFDVSAYPGILETLGHRERAARFKQGLTMTFDQDCGQESPDVQVMYPDRDDRPVTRRVRQRLGGIVYPGV